MPLFKSNTQRAHSTSPTRDSTTSGGMFTRNSRASMDSGSSASSTGGGSRSGGGFLGLGRNKNYLDNDPSIMAARQKIADAERAEREADEALRQARVRTNEARETVRILEREALEDAQRAKAKQAEAKAINKSAKKLGRH
ncbi:hypothetical protein NMY22_g3367 [Coprinellus aureogranulatus]|nr:hypothetical protein NMY22_g3367 [Coprinellus aureogranulatus]